MICLVFYKDRSSRTYCILVPVEGPGALWVFDVLLYTTQILVLGFCIELRVRELKGKPQQSFITIFFSKDGES